MSFSIGVKMCSKNIFFALRFWVGLPQNLGFDFSMSAAQRGTALSVQRAVVVATPRLGTWGHGRGEVGGLRNLVA